MLLSVALNDRSPRNLKKDSFSFNFHLENAQFGHKISQVLRLIWEKRVRFFYANFHAVVIRLCYSILPKGSIMLIWAQNTVSEWLVIFVTPCTNRSLVSCDIHEKCDMLHCIQDTWKTYILPFQTGLESHLSWRPHVMSHLATMQRLPNKYVLVFIEKNTELKDSVSLDSVSFVKALKWNTDGTVLAVMKVDHRVLLYTCSNCHW